jgi:predicted TIM-barrel fold metal-dependent hydrolase
VIVDAYHHFLDPARIDYPFLRLLRGYRELLDTGRAVLAGCSPAECVAVLGENANRVYRLGLIV